MRILYVLTSLGVGGAERQALTLAARIRQRGHQVKLLVLQPSQPGQWAAPLPAVHLNVRKAPLPILAGAFQAARLVRAFRPDLIHSHGFHGNLAARLLKLACPRGAVISTLHNVYEGGSLRMRAYRWTDGLSRRTVAVSQAVLERFTALGAIAPDRCCVIPNAVEEGELVPDAARRRQMRAAMKLGDEFVWLAAGRLAPAKDYPNLLRAMARLRAARPDVQLWIAGHDLREARSGLQALAADLKLEGVHWLGHRGDLPALFDAADGFVLASAWEGMPVVLAEAMTMAKPAVATAVGGVPELLGDCGALVPAGDPVRLADAMLAVMESGAQERARLGCAARARILAQFTMPARALQWERLYIECSAETGGPRSRPQARRDAGG